MLSEKHQKSGTVQEEDWTNCVWDGHIPTLENTPTPLFEEQLKFIGHGS